MHWDWYFIVMDYYLQLLYNPLQNTMDNNDGNISYTNIDDAANKAMAPLKRDWKYW